MKKFLVMMILLSLVLAINPPQNGNFPDGFWEKMNEQNIGQTYGDPGWVRKISEQMNGQTRDAQLEFFIPVLLGQYADVPTTYFNASDYDELLFGENPTGSMKEYFDEISYGNFPIDGTSGGWYQSTLTMSQAVDNAKQYVAEIAALSDPDFNFANYDNDGPDNIPNSGDDDGYVDGIIVVYSGCGAEWGEGNDNLWPHMSSLGSYEYETNDVGANGSNIIVSSYAVCPELAGGGDCYTDIIRPMGVYAHEFGHILGLPDLYDRDASDGNSDGIGEWCLMASGSWLGWAGETPAHMSSWCKIQMGWVDPITITNDQTNVSIPQLATTPTVYKVWEDDYYWSRYFLIENRQKVGFDSDLNGSGLLVYHIDENRRYGENAWSSGPVNDNEGHKLVDLEEADGLEHLDDQVNRGDEGDAFPGSTDNRTFNDSSNPSANRYDNSSTGISFSNISDPDSLMTLDIQYRPNWGYALAYDPMGMSLYGFGNSEESDKWSAVSFDAEEAGFLTEIDIGMRYAMDYTIYIYDSFDGSYAGTLIESINGQSERNGWLTVPVDSIPIDAGQNFLIAIKFSSQTYPIAFDNMSALSGRSYYSTNGEYFDNVLSSYGNANIRAKISTDSYVSSIDEKGTIPEEVTLHQNYPNPFNPSTTIAFTLKYESKVLLEVYDVKGRKIDTLIDKNLRSGVYDISWNGMEYSSGIYFIRLSTPELERKQKITLLK